MSEEESAPVGAIVWQDLTVEGAAGVRDFYGGVVGWTFGGCDMGGYEDYEVRDRDGNTVAGICHARGSNSSLPPQWLLYAQVDDVEAAAARAEELGGAVLDGPRSMGNLPFAVIRDPAGAVLGLVGR